MICLYGFPINIDLQKKHISVEGIFRVAKENGITHVDALCVPDKKLCEYKSAMNSNGVSVNCYTPVLSFGKVENLLEKAVAGTAGCKGVEASLMMIVLYYYVIDTRKVKKFGRDMVRELMNAGYTAAVKADKKLLSTVKHYPFLLEQ